MLQTSGLNYSYDSRLVDAGSEDFLLSLNIGRSGSSG